jgi:predicted MFS family arabinose efflux permease
MIFFGFGEIIGSSVNGTLIDKLGLKRFIICNIIEIIIAHIVIVSFSQILTFQIAFAAAVTFTWGFQDSGGVIIALCVSGFQFESKTLPFSINKLIMTFFQGSFIYIEMVL